MVPGVIVLIGVLAAFGLTRRIHSAERTEFEAVTDRVIADIRDGYADLAGIVRLYATANELGIPSTEFQDSFGIAPSRISGAIRGLALLPGDGSDPSILTFFPGDGETITMVTTSELTPVTGGRYLMAVPTGPDEARALFSMATLIGTVVEPSNALITVTATDGDELVHQGEPSRNDLVLDRRVELGGRTFALTLRPGSSYARSGATWAGIVTFALSLVLAGAAWKVQTSVRGRIRAEAERAEMAEEMNAGKDRFLASVAHGLRTPLSVIMGTTMELLASSEVHSVDEQREMLEMAANESISIRDTIEDMLVTARLANGDLSVNPRRTDLCELAEDHVASLDARPGISLVIDTSTAGEVEVDPGRWIHAFRNLLSNAADHATTEVHIGFTRTKHDFVATIADDGPGLPAAQVEQAFAPYSALSTPTTAPPPVGVGLSVARGLARLLGGDVTYRRENDRSVFTFSVPVEPARANGTILARAVPSIAS